MRGKTLFVAIFLILLCIVLFGFRSLDIKGQKVVIPNNLDQATATLSPSFSSSTTSTPYKTATTKADIQVTSKNSQKPVIPTPTSKSTGKPNPTPTATPTLNESEKTSKYVPTNDKRPVGIDYVAPKYSVEILGCTEDSDYYTINSLVHLQGGVYNYKVGWEPVVPIYNGEEFTVRINLQLPKGNVVPGHSYNNALLYLSGIWSGNSYKIDTGKVKPSDHCKIS